MFGSNFRFKNIFGDPKQGESELDSTHTNPLTSIPRSKIFLDVTNIVHYVVNDKLPKRYTICVIGFTFGRAGIAQLVENKLPKLGVAGSNPVARSMCLLVFSPTTPF